MAGPEGALTPERKVELQRAAQALQVDISPIADDELLLLTNNVQLICYDLKLIWRTWHEDRRVSGDLTALAGQERIWADRMIPLTVWHHGMRLGVGTVADLHQPLRRETIYNLTKYGLGVVEVQAPGPEVLLRRALRLRELPLVNKYISPLLAEVEKHLGEGAIMAFHAAEQRLEDEFMTKHLPPTS